MAGTCGSPAGTQTSATWKREDSMEKQDWEGWYPKFIANLPEPRRHWLDESEELQQAIAREDYYHAVDVVYEILEAHE